MRKVLLLTLGIVFVLSGTSFAFHDAGVADCAGCHTMHNSDSQRELTTDGGGLEPGDVGYDTTWAYSNLIDPDSPAGNPYLLIDATPSDVCLVCHRRYGQFGGTPDAPDKITPAGNFIFLLEDNINDGHGGATNPIPGSAGGHNLNAPGFGLSTDATMATSPGGSFPSASMGCTSCHDPHGTDDYRLLYGAGRSVQAGLYTFTAAAPVAYGPSRSTAETPGSHSAFVSGMSAWCGNCHGAFHNDNTSSTIHKTNTLLPSSMVTVYNSYNGTADLTGAVYATAYLPEVPFEDVAFTSLADTSSTVGASATSRVMCLSCHRAHASSAANIGRWEFGVTLLDEDGDESGSYKIPDPYSNVNQRSLCNKCHKKDEFDHGSAL